MLNKKNLIGLSVVNIELTSWCNKHCWMCGRRKIEDEYSELCDWGNIEFDLLKKIERQLPSGIIIQFHNNGEPLLYPRFGEAVRLFKHQIKCVDTNAKLLLEKTNEIIDNLDTLTISVIQGDHEGDKQYEIVKKFLEIKEDRKPFMIYRLLGNIKIVPGSDNAIINEEREQRWYKLPGLVATRVLHNPMGSFEYKKKVTIPEVGFCLDLMNHLVIDRYGDIYPCVRFNPDKYNCLGNIKKHKLIDIWNGPIRYRLIKEHIKGNRKCSELCKKCDFWGIPRGE